MYKLPVRVNNTEGYVQTNDFIIPREFSVNEDPDHICPPKAGQLLRADS